MDIRLKNVCFVLPTYNEAANIETTISNIYRIGNALDKYKIFILVVDDNSPDGTQKVVKRLIKEYLERQSYHSKIKLNFCLIFLD